VLLAAFLAVAAAASLAAQAPKQVDLGLITDSRPVSATFVVRNPSSDRPARVDFISACSCLNVTPDRLVLAAGESRSVQVTYEPEGRPGELRRSLLVRSSLRELDNGRLTVTGTASWSNLPSPAESGCDECRKMAELYDEETMLQDYARSIVLVDFYADPGCDKCEEYLRRELPRAVSVSPRKVRLVRHSILDPAELAQLTQRLQRSGRPLEQLPVAFVGAEPLQGLDAIRAGLAGALAPR
jgi:hypothetical protein